MPEWERKFCKFEILIYFCSAEKIISAGVAKLVDALDLGSSGLPMGVQVPLRAPNLILNSNYYSSSFKILRKY